MRSWRNGTRRSLCSRPRHKAKAEAKIEYYKTIEALQQKRDEARTKLHELKTAGDEAGVAIGVIAASLFKVDLPVPRAGASCTQLNR